MRRGHKQRISATQAGLIAIAILVALTYFGFTKAIPFKHHYEIKAAFENANNLRKNSFVRIAGVNIGKVTKIEHIEDGKQGAVVTLRIDDNGLPIHEDAKLTVRPRIFLEGNFFVDVQPGSPSTPTLDDGDTIPINQTAAPVQLDQILTALQSDTREDLKVVLKEFSSALDKGGAEGFQKSIPYWESAYKNSAIVNQATLGELEHDLSGYIDKAGAVAEAIDRSPEQLKSLITDFNTTAAAFAAEQGNLESTIAELPRTLRAAQPALGALNASFPAVRRLVSDLRPAVRSSGPALEAGVPLVKQLRGLFSQSELRGLANDLRGVVPDLATLQERSVPLNEQVRPAASCNNEVILPWTLDKVPDPTFPAKGPVFEEQVQWLPGIAGESRSGDANGQWFRVLVGNGPFYYKADDLFFASNNPITGSNPPKPQGPNQGRPPINYDNPCETQARPDLRTIPGQAPEQISSKLNANGKKSLARARTRALKWTERAIKREGLGKRLKVLEKDISLEQAKAALEAIK